MGPAKRKKELENNNKPQTFKKRNTLFGIHNEYDKPSQGGRAYHGEQENLPLQESSNSIGSSSENYDKKDSELWWYWWI